MPHTLSRSSVRAVLAVLFSTVFLWTGPVRADFSPGCPLPFESVKVHHSIDTACPAPEGTAKTPKQKAADRGKNNFCATGTPATVTDLSFKKLQAKAKQLHIPFGSQSSFPSDRAALQAIYTTSDGATIGEGSVVRYAGFVLSAKHSDLGTGETCNCQKPDSSENDVHIGLAQKKGTPACSGLVAEMSPHFRPVAWNPAFLKKQRNPIRITGQLFFDSVHSPCTPGHPASPARMSLWEIHPVYACEVCMHSALADCPIGDDTVWQPIAQ